jgi:alpha-1,6-mannosyltransferase
MRILDVNSSYSPTGGGIRKYHERKLEYFSGTSEHRAALAVPGAGFGLELNGDGRIYTLQSVPLAGSGYRTVLDGGGLNSVIDDFRPDIVEIGSPYLMPALTRSAIASDPIPTVGFYHTDFPDSYVRPYARKILPAPLVKLLYELARRHVRRTYGGMTAVFAASKCMLRKLRALGVTRLFHTPLGVDPDLFTPAARSDSLRRSLGVPAGGIMVLFLARLHWEKGLDRLMEAYPLFRNPSRLKLVVGGRGPHRHLLDDFVRKYPEVSVLPYLSGSREVARIMASADVFMALGQYETFGLAGLESVSCGTVTVFPDRGASAEMAHDIGLIPPFDADSAGDLAEKVELAISRVSMRSVEMLRDYAVSEHRWSDVFGRIEANYGRILEAYREGDLDRLEPDGEWWD